MRNLANERRVRVRINDRGPFVKDRVIDLSRRAARSIEMIHPGTTQVELRLVQRAPEEEENRRYAVQVGAFADPSRARAFAEELRPRYPEATISVDGVWARVHLGLFRQRPAAEALLREVESAGLEGFIVALD